jgi:hypothetical protein
MMVSALLLWCSASSVAFATDLPPDKYDRSRYGLNFTLGSPIFDNPNTAGHNLNVYLEWAEQQGFAKEARVVCDPSWGPFVTANWFPVFQSRGWKVSCVVGDHPAGWSTAEAYTTSHVSWVTALVERWGPRGENLLIMIEPMNEPWNRHVAFPKSWLRPYHLAIKHVANAHGLPVAAGYFSGQKDMAQSIWKYYRKAGFDWSVGGDVDIVVFNTTEKSSVSKVLRYLEEKIPSLETRIVCTECGWKHLTKLPASRFFVYTCIGENTGKSHLNRCPESLPGLHFEGGQP